MTDRARILKLVWRYTHRDFKGKFEDGTRTILVGRVGEGTCLVPLDALTDQEALEKIPRAVRAQEGLL